MAQQQSAFVDQIKEILQLYGIDVETNGSEPQDKNINYADLMKKTQNKVDELNSQADELIRKLGMSREEIENYSQNPQNFSKEQWEMLQKVRRECEVFKEKTIKALDEAGAQVIEQQKPEKNNPTKRKEKKKFVKKKNWLQL